MERELDWAFHLHKTYCPGNASRLSANSSQLSSRDYIPPWLYPTSYGGVPMEWLPPMETKFPHKLLAYVGTEHRMYTQRAISVGPLLCCYYLQCFLVWSRNNLLCSMMPPNSSFTWKLACLDYSSRPLIMSVPEKINLEGTKGICTCLRAITDGPVCPCCPWSNAPRAHGF